MYVRNGARIHRLAWDRRGAIAALVLLAVATEAVEPYLRPAELFSIVYVGVFSTALSIFLVFRFNEAYDRWWEARKLWGALVNHSRDLARQALSLLGPDARRELAPRVVRRQIAFAHALRQRLRGDDEAARRAVLARLLPEEAEDYATSDNVPSALLLRQSEDLVRALGDDVAGSVLLVRLDETLARLHDVQGGCERIKNTAFPDSVALLTRWLVWALVVLLMFATLGPEGRDGAVDVVVVCLMSMGYLAIETLGNDLKNPFEGRPNDTPMTAICIMIERDLLEALGETDLPPPLEPERGVLI